MAFSNGYIFGFAGAVCVACSLLVAGAATSLKERQDLNKLRDLRGNILGALQLEPENGSRFGPEEIDRLWAERVELDVFTKDGTKVDTSDTSFDLDGDGDVDIDDVATAREAVKNTDAAPDIVAMYRRVDDGGATGAWAMPVYGKGLWGPLSGYLALAPDLSEVIGVTFDAPKETPGLGAEIMEPPFKQQWAGKKIFEDGEPRGVRVAKGDADALYPDETAYWVDGVSGATITSRGVDAMVVEGVEKDYRATLMALRSQ